MNLRDLIERMYEGDIDAFNIVMSWLQEHPHDPYFRIVVASVKQSWGRPIPQKYAEVDEKVRRARLNTAVRYVVESLESRSILSAAQFLKLDEREEGVSYPLIVSWSDSQPQNFYLSAAVPYRGTEHAQIPREDFISTAYIFGFSGPEWRQHVAGSQSPYSWQLASVDPPAISERSKSSHVHAHIVVDDSVPSQVADAFRSRVNELAEMAVSIFEPQQEGHE